MAKFQVICSPFLVDEDELHDAAKEAADAILEAVGAETHKPGRPNVTAAEASAEGIRKAMDLPSWVGIPPELVNAVWHEILNRTSAATRRLGDYCPS